jgi:hypothetical protein
MNKGFLKSILYYLIGLGLAGTSYLVVGHPYIHGPGLHQIIILLTFIGGFLWLAGATRKYFLGHRSESLKGTIFTNLFMSVGFTLFIVYTINEARADSEFEKNADKITIEGAGDTTIMYYGGSIVYLRVNDSVLLNFIDSAKINWSEVELKKE